MSLFSTSDIDDRLTMPRGTGIIYDDRMTEHFCPWDPNMPENPKRITEPFKRCQNYNLIERCVRLEAQHADNEFALTLHGKKLLDLIRSSVSMTEDQLKHISSMFDGVYFNNKTYDAAMLSLGSVIEMTEQIVSGKLLNGMTITRPPGHHAMFDQFCGYCYFNNVAIAAKHALDSLGMERILIVDWDIHHGQGTQYMFYDDPRVVYFSVHRYEYGHFWPNLRESDYDYIGEGKGKGFNINVPLNKTGLGNSEYMAIFQQLLLPIAYEFCPNMVLVSAGFDSAIGDEKGEMEVTPVFYAHLLHQLMNLANGKVCVVLEGGYCINSLSESVAMTLRTLLGDPCPPVDGLGEPDESVVTVILQLISELRPFWKCLQFQGDCPDNDCDRIARKTELYSKEMNPPLDKVEAIAEYYPVHTPEVFNALDKRINDLIDNAQLSVPSNRVCLVYDERMRLHKNHVDLGHPERPDRITRIYNVHQDTGLLDRCKIIPARFATDDEILLVHDEDYLDDMIETKTTKPRDLKEKQCFYNSVYLCTESCDSARLAVGSALACVDHVLTGQSRSGIAIVRPPGHHAEIDKACGFCLFNNVAIAAKYAQNNHKAKKILILDWDVHHGNGIQQAFEDDPSILYISIHRYEYATFFPAKECADFDKVGTGPGEGYNINIPWNGVSRKRPIADPEYIAAFQQVVMPVAYEFAPDLVLVSAGFDAARGDPLGGLGVTPEGYAHMTHMLSGLANGKIILVLEGGYNLHSISMSMAMCTSTLLGDPCPSLPHCVPRSTAVESINNVIETHKRYWSCLQYQVDLPPRPELLEKEKLPQSPGDAHMNSLDSSVNTVTSELEQLSVSDISLMSPNTSTVSNEGDASFNDNDNMVENEKQPLAAAEKQSLAAAEKQSLAAAEKQPLVAAADAGREGGGDEISGVSDDDSALGACGGSELSHGPTVREYLGNIVDGEDVTMHAVIPLPWCPHLTEIRPIPSCGIDVFRSCMDCGDPRENWVCLTCYEVYCGRYTNEHMLMHGLMSEHRMVLSFSDLSVWCYSCDSYVHNEFVMEAKRAAHISKFGSDIP